MSNKPADAIGAKERSGHVDWDQIVREQFQGENANEWHTLEIDKYQRCPYGRLKNPIKQLRRRGLEIDTLRHFEQHENVPDPDSGKLITVRSMLDVYSLQAIYRTSEQS